MNVEISSFTKPETDLQHILHRLIYREHIQKCRIRLCFDVLITVAVVYILFSVLFGIAVIRGDSMEPNLKNGSIVLFYRMDKNYRRDDIVLLRPDGRDELLVKRVVAVGNDTVVIDSKTGAVQINGAPEKTRFLPGKTLPKSSGVKYPLKVPFHCVFVLGDNRETSVDSRVIGTVSNKSLIGKIIFEFKSLD